MALFPTLSTGRRTLSSSLPSAEQILKNRLTLNRIKRQQKQEKPQPTQNKPEVHYEPKEGVYYSFSEAQKPTKRMLGFREWCEQVYDPSRSSSTRPGTDR